MDTLIENYENLANAIILKAVDDYQKALKGETDKDKQTVKDIEKFFRSDYFMVLTKADPNIILAKAKGDIVNGINTKRKTSRIK